MGIYIPNMEKPKSCYNHCLEDFIANEEIGCPLKTYKESHQYKAKIHPNCPIIDIVRCGECKHWYSDADCGMACEFTNFGQPSNGFCNWGERK